MANKYAKKEEVEQKQFMTASIEWTGNRIPEFVRIPFTSKNVKVAYMKNGKFMLEDGHMGTYKRVLDNNKTQERIIIIEMELE